MKELYKLKEIMLLKDSVSHFYVPSGGDAVIKGNPLLKGESVGEHSFGTMYRPGKFIKRRYGRAHL